MTENNKFRFSDEFYENLGDLKAELANPSVLDQARFHLATKFIKGESLLDIGTYWGDFLMAARKKIPRIYGTEINDLRRDSVNEVLGKEIVCTDFRHGQLNNFETNSIDTVVCMEVLEHIDNVEHAVSEIVRVARNRIIITVPYNQEPQYYLCVHCNRLTPYMNHLHRYDELTMRKLFFGMNSIHIFTFGIRFLYKIPLSLGMIVKLDCLINQHKHVGRWMFAIIDK